MKSTTRLHFKCKKGVERAKLKFKDYFPDWEFIMDLT